LATVDRSKHGRHDARHRFAALRHIAPCTTLPQRSVGNRAAPLDRDPPFTFIEEERVMVAICA
jgi:hypothetical protein